MSDAYSTPLQEVTIVRAIRTAVGDAKALIDRAWTMNPEAEHNEREKLLLRAGEILALLHTSIQEYINALHEPKRGVITYVLASVSAGASAAVRLKSTYCLERLLDPEGLDAERLLYAVSILESEHFGFMHPFSCPRCGSGHEEHDARHDAYIKSIRNVFCRRCGAYVQMTNQ